MRTTVVLGTCVLLSWVLFLGSCGIYSNYPKRSLEANGLIRAELAADTSSRAPQRWESLFTDPALQALICEGLERNASVSIARLQLEEAKATLRGAQLALLPAANLTGRVNTSSFDGSKPELGYTVGGEVSWTIDLFGRLNNTRKAAKASLEEREAYAQAVRVQTISTIAELYYTLELLDAQVAVTAQNLESWRQSVATQEALFEAGQAQRANINQAKASLLQAEITYNGLKVQRQKSENSLCALLGRPSAAVKRGQWGSFVIPERFSIGVPDTMLSQRPDVRQAEASLKRAFYSTNVARSAFYPSLTLSGSAGWTNSAGSMIVNPGAMIWQVAASVLQPIFNRGQLTSNLTIAKARQEEALVQFRQTVLNAGNEVNNALADLQNARTTRALEAEQVARLESTLRDTEAQMRYGSGNALQVLMARQSLLNAQLGQLNTAYKELSSYIKLWAALGGR